LYQPHFVPERERASGKVYVRDVLQNFGTWLVALKTSTAPTAAAIAQEKDLLNSTFLRGR
jgi:hypothetical protein